MLYNAAGLPPEPVDNGADSAGVVVQEALRINIFSPQDGNLCVWPDRTQEVQGGVWPIVREWVVVLLRVSASLYYRGPRHESRTMYVEEMNSKAAVRFFFTRNSSANLLNRCSVSAADGAGLIALQGGGVTTDCLAASTLVGGSGRAETGKASAARRGTTKGVHIFVAGASGSNAQSWE